MKLIFDRRDESLLVIDQKRGGVWYYNAANNVDSSSKGIWPPGVYTSNGLYDKDDKEDGRYGKYFLLFKNFTDSITGKKRTAMGIHAGRYNRPDRSPGKRKGYAHATMGCIRTTIAAMDRIALLHREGERVQLWVV
jgi:hypothetical protein